MTTNVWHGDRPLERMALFVRQRKDALRFPFSLLFLVGLASLLCIIVYTNVVTPSFLSRNTSVVRRPMGLKPIKTREEMGKMLNELGFETGVEVGVQKGRNATQLLKNWKSCKSFALVDVWGKQENYEDKANKDDAQQEEIYQEARERLADYVNITKFYRMLSVDAVKHFQDESLDFVYIDARHDYCGVTEDLNAYWPKVRRGGIMAGHDFLYALEQPPPDDWSICQDGSKHPGAVRGAVEEFALKHGLVISVMFDEPRIWKSWMVQKPWVDYATLQSLVGKTVP